MRIALQRELRTSARRSGTFWARVFAGALAALALFRDAAGTFAGRSMFFTAVTLAFLACIFEGVRRGAGAIADERNDGTLGLLFLTQLTGPQLMFGKFMAIGLSAFQTALAAAPVLAASLLLGGVSFGEFVRSSIALWHILSLCICISVISSVRATDPVRVMTRTWAMVALCALLLTILFATRLVRWANPITPLMGITDGNYYGGRPAFWISLLLYQTLAAGSLFLAGRRLFKDWQAAEEAPFRQSSIKVSFENYPKNSNRVPARVRDTPRWFTANAMEWLTLRDMQMHSGRWGALLLTVIAAALALAAPVLAIFIGFIGFGSLIFSLCVTSTRVVARLQQSGALELLLTTPLGERGVIEGHRAGLRKMFRWPFVTGYCVLLIFALQQEPDDRFGCLYILSGLILLAWATPWIGTMVALKSKNPRRAVLWTVLLVLVLPRFGFCFLADPFYFAILGIAARIYLRRHFRRLAAERFIAVD
jgi:hypothetical protein